MAQLVLSAAGAGIGGSLFSGAVFTAAGGFTIGAQIGWIAGGMLASSFQTQKVQGPRLNDLTVTGSAYGSPVPYVFGSPRISGQWIWSSQKREISTTTSRRAKGGPKIQSTSFTYEADMFLMLTSNEMAGVRRIWVNGELQWTAADDADFGSINASSALARRVTVYTGADDQLPDPTYEAAVGAGAPAYIGHLTIFFEALQLGTSGQIPNVTVEVVQNGGESTKTSQLYEWTAAVSTVQGFSDDSKTFTANPRQAWFDGSYFDYRYIDPSGQVYGAGSYQFPSFGFTMNGRSDRPVIVCSAPNLNQAKHIFDPESQQLLTVFCAGIGDSYVLKGNDLVIYTVGWGGSTHSIIWRFDLLQGTSALTSLSLPYSVNSMAIIDDMVYVREPVNGAPSTIRVYDLETLTLQDSFSTPTGNGAAEILEDSVGDIYFLNTTTLYRRVGATWEVVIGNIPIGYGAFNSTGGAGANPYYSSESLYTTSSYVAGAVSNRVRTVWKAIEADAIPLDEVVSELFQRAGIDPSDFDASALATQSVRGYAISPTTTRAVMDVLAQAYHFECSPGEKLVMVPLGGSVVATIPYEDLGTAPYGNVVDDPLPLVMRNDLETPGFVTVKYMNAANDGQPGAERSFRISTDSEAEMFVEVSILFMPSEAKKMADFLANLLEASLLSVQEIALQIKNTALQPCDPVLLTDRDGSTYRVRLQQRDDADGIIKFTAVFDNPQSTSSDGVTDDDYESTTQIRVAALTQWVYGDWPLFRDVDDNVGFYWAADGLGQFWPGAVLMESPDDVSYGQVSSIEERGVVGTTVTALGTWTGGNVVDTGNSVRVNVGQGTLASITYDEQLASEKNVFMIGDECVIARTVTYVSAGIYDLKDLLRGRQGTEWAVGTHSIGDPVALIQMAGMRRVAQDLSKLNVDYYYRAVTMGRLLESANPRIESNTGVSSKPWAPSNLTPTRSGTDLTPQWVRRTRLSENWLMDAVPLGEEEQLWRVRRYTSSAYTTVAEEQEVATVGGATFTSAPNPSYIGVSQWSARVGWGYELRGAI